VAVSQINPLPREIVGGPEVMVNVNRNDKIELIDVQLEKRDNLTALLPVGGDNPSFAELAVPSLLVAIDLENGYNRQATIALGVIQRLFAYGRLSGAQLDEVMAAVANVGRDNVDDGVQMAVLAVLRASILSAPSVYVHGQSLMMGVRACYQVYLPAAARRRTPSPPNVGRWRTRRSPTYL
jgi:hypothetical protein